MFGGGPVGRGCSLSAGWGGEAKLLVEAGLSGSTALPGASLCCSIGSGCPCPATVHETLATALAQDRADRGVWRTLSPQQQALLVLAHLHDNVTYAALARGFGIGVATVYRYIVEACRVLTAMAPTLDDALDQARSKAYLVLDGTVRETGRVRTTPWGADRGYYSGKTHRHGMNMQVITDALGRLVWCSPALPGGWHDVRCAKTHDIPNALAPLTAQGLQVLVDKGYIGIGAGINTPLRAGRRNRSTGRFESKSLSENERAVNAAHSKNRAPGERGNAQLKCWRVLRRYRGCPRRLTTIVASVWMLITAGQSAK